MKDPYLLIKYVEGTATEAERQLVDTWLKASPANPEILQTYLRIWNHSRRAGDLGGLDIEGDLALVRSKISAPKVLGSKRSLYFWRIAAAVLLLVGLSGLWIFLRQPLKPAYLTAINAQGQPHQILLLEDGTKVTLNANSTLKYPATFTSDTRTVSLEGEAFFEVTKDAGKPFIIQTSYNEVKVLGTQFNLRAFEQEDECELTVVEGEVLFSEKNSVDKQLTLTANQRAVFRKETGEMQQQAIPDLNFLSWKTGKLVFENAAFNQVVQALSRHFQIKIVLAAGMATDGCFVNSEFVDQTLDSVLDELGVILGMGYNHKPDYIEITFLNCAG